LSQNISGNPAVRQRLGKGHGDVAGGTGGAGIANRSDFNASTKIWGIEHEEIAYLRAKLGASFKCE
jgi:hypothetical protein